MTLLIKGNGDDLPAGRLRKLIWLHATPIELRPLLAWLEP